MLARPMKGGTTYADHLRSVVRQSGGRIVPPELLSKTPEPTRALYLWNYFAQVSKRRAHDGFSGTPQPLSYSEVEAWTRLNRVRLQTFEVDLLFGLDDVFLQVKAKEMLEKSQREEKKPVTKERK